MRARCGHVPRVLNSSGQCVECKRVWAQRSYRKKIGWQALWDAQGGACAFCSQPLADDNTTHRDHNHATGKVRGLVHAQCNLMIAGIEDAVALVGLHNVVRYLSI